MTNNQQTGDKTKMDASHHINELEKDLQKTTESLKNIKELDITASRLGKDGEVERKSSNGSILRKIVLDSMDEFREQWDEIVEACNQGGLNDYEIMRESTRMSNYPDHVFRQALFYRNEDGVDEHQTALKLTLFASGKLSAEIKAPKFKIHEEDFVFQDEED